MARKRSKPMEDPLSSEEEEKGKEVVTEEEDSDEDEGYSSEEEEEENPKTQAAPQTQKTPPAKKSAAPAATQSDESDSDTDGPAPEVKLIATKPMKENLKKGRSKSLASVPVKASATKRASEPERGPGQAKRAKNKAGEEGTGGGDAVAEEGKKTGALLFQRVFTEGDEIALLKGMLDYYAKKGDDPYADMNAFYEYVKKSIHTDVTKAQIIDKVKRLRRKYENNARKGKGKEKGGERTLSKASEQISFNLSEKIWGKEGICGKNENSVAKSNGKSKALLGELDIDKNGSDSGVCLFPKRYGGVGGLEEEILKHGLEKVGAEKKVALERRWRKLHTTELELFVERCMLMAEQGRELQEVYKSEGK